MAQALRSTADQILAHNVARMGGAPGVVAIATDRSGNIYEGAAGVRQLGAAEPMTTDSVMLIASCTKAITATALMQLVEEGQARLDDPAQAYVPEIGRLQVLEGFAAGGEPRLRAPRAPITLGHLLLHTSGCAYDFFSEDLLRYRTLREIPSILSCTFASIQDVLIHDPGAQWTYGCGIDWAGRVVEALRGKRLGEVMRERIFDPLGMQEIGFVMTPAMAARRVPIHQRAPDGQLTALPEVVLPQPPEMDMGGHALYATIPEYMKFVRMILNDGAGPHGRVLQAATVARMAQNGLGALKTSAWVTCNPGFANSGDFFPGSTKSWGYSFMINDEPTPSGRPAGSLMWAGIANTFYWIDRRTGVGGMWSSQVLPFQDVGCYPGFVDFETVVYRTLR
jgi:methyl acetate hydrolase